MGGIFGFSPQECSQETPNTQTSVFESRNGKMLGNFEKPVAGYPTIEANLGIKICNCFMGNRRDGWK